MNKKYRNNNHILSNKNSQIIIFFSLYFIFLIFYLLFQTFIINNIKINPDINDIAKEDIIINKDISIVDELKSEEEKKIFLQEIPPVYNIYDSVFYRQWGYFEKLFNYISIERPIPQEIEKYIKSKTDLNITSSRVIPILIQITDNSSLVKSMRTFIYSIYSKGVSSLSQNDLITNSKKLIYVDWYRQFDTIRKEMTTDAFITEDKKDEKIEEIFNQIFDGTDFEENLLPDEKEIFLDFIKNNLKENLIYDQLQTDEIKKNVLDNFTPKRINLTSGTILVKKGEKISAEKKRLLMLIQKSVRSNLIIIILSSFVILMFTGLILAFYLFSFSNSFKLYKRYSVYFFILLFLSNCFYILYELKSLSFIPSFFSFPILLLILLVEFAYSDKEKFLVYLSLLFILFVITNFDYILLFYGLLLFTALVSFPIQLHSYKKTVFSRIAFSLLVTIIFSLMVNFLFFKSYKIVELLISGILNIFISMILFFGLTPIIENIFNFPTNSKLLEICDLNNQFFSDFMLKAPGTYHHSVIVATLAEKAAASCNCNPYIAKAGGLYHDIGKIRYSKYFVENQHGENPTVEVLNPNMAVTIIKNHVKYGVIEAQKLHLPKEVIDIIEEHHGTSLISYFYVKALEKKLENVNKINFCYNYPKPKTKEAAIIMIADSIEAASRTLKNTDKKSIEKMVEDVIANKSKEGQLEESPITLKDLYFIKKSIINSLYSMYHNRVNYPDEKELKKLEEENR